MPEQKILVVDDEQAILRLLCQVFTNAGYDVASAETGAQALETVKTQTIPVMFFDLNMPDMDGIELCRKVKAELPMTIIYAITGFASLFELSECREAGFDDYFKKPVNIAKLLETARAAFKTVDRWKVI